MVDSLNMKVHEMHLASLSIRQSDLRGQIDNHTVEDEMYVKIKDNLQQQNLEKRYEGYNLEEDGLLTYKRRIYIRNIVELRRVVMDEIHKLRNLVTEDTRRQLLRPESSTFGQE